MNVFLMRSWTHHEPNSPKGEPGVLSSEHRPPEDQAAVMLHLGNIPVEEDVTVEWLVEQIEALGFLKPEDGVAILAPVEGAVDEEDL